MLSSAPLSQSQFGIYVECASHAGEAYYNLPYIYVLDPSLDGERLCRAIETAVQAHPTLFTRISINDEGEPLQTVDDTESFSIQIEVIDELEPMKAQLVVPFDLVGGRLFRMRLLRDSSHYYLFIDYHHIIADGTSMSLMLKDIDRAYKGEILEPEMWTMAQQAQTEVEERQAEALP